MFPFFQQNRLDSGVEQSGGRLGRDRGSPPAAAVKPFEGRMGGAPVRATPVGAPNERGQTTYRVEWKGVSVDVLLTGQFGRPELSNGSYTKARLEAELEAAAARRHLPHDFTLGGQRGVATPFGPPSPTGQIQYNVEWNGVEVAVNLSRRFTDDELAPGRPTRRMLDAAVAGRQREEAGRNPQPHPFTMGGVQGVAVPRETNPATGQTRYELNWNNRTAEVLLTGQFNNSHLEDGKPAKRMLLAATPRPSAVAGVNPGRVDGEVPPKTGLVPGDLAMVTKSGDRIPSAVESVSKLAQQFANGPQLKAGDPNAPRSEQRYANPTQKAILGALHEVASGPAALATFAGMGAEKIGLGDGLRRAGEAWQGNIDKFYGGGPGQRHADVTNSVEWETGKMGARIVDFAAGVAMGVGATSGPRAATNAAARPARRVTPAPDIAARTPPGGTAPATAPRTLPPGHSFNGPDLNMRAPAPGVPNTTARVPPSATPSGAASAASNVPVNPPAASGALRAPEIGSNSAIRRAAADDANALLFPLSNQKVAEQRVAKLMNSANLPGNIKDDVAAAVQKEATRRAGNASPQVASQRIDQYIDELRTQPQQLNLISTRADRARLRAVDAKVSDFVKSQQWSNPERVQVAKVLQSELQGSSLREATQRLDQIARRPADLNALAAQAKVSNPINVNPLDQVNLLNDRAAVAEAAKVTSSPKIDPVEALARFGKFEMDVINAPKKFLVQGGKDIYNTIIPPDIRNVAAGGINTLEKVGDVGIRIGNALTGAVHKGSNLLPEWITQPATSLTTGVAKAGGAISNVVNSKEMRAAQTVAGNAMALGIVSQAPTLERYSGVVGAGDPHVDNIAGMAFIPDGSYVTGWRSTENTPFFADVSTAFFHGWHEALGAPGRFTVSESGPGLLGTQLWRALANINSVIVAPKGVDPNLFRAQATMSSSFIGGARNPSVLGTGPLPNQVGSGVNVGTQFSLTASAPSTTSYAGIVFGPFFPILRGPDTHYLNSAKLQEGWVHANPLKNATSAVGGNAAYGTEETDEGVQNLRLWLNSLSPILKYGHDYGADLLLPTYGEKLERMEQLPLYEDGTKVEQRP